MDAWQAFVIEHGWRARGYELAHVLGKSVNDVERTRQGGKCARLGATHTFEELFSLWRGRPPLESEYPPPRKSGQFEYDWQLPEERLLMSLVGRVGVTEIQRVLERRLRTVTGNVTATRRPDRIVAKIHKLGLSTAVFVGGMTIAQVAHRAGITTTVVHFEIQRQKLRSFRIGVRHAITEQAYRDWMDQRLPAPPKGWVKLWNYRRQLGQKHDRLSWYAKQGYIPQALFCAGHRWWCPPAVVEEMLRRRREGRPAMWAGYTHRSTSRRGFELWSKRKHARCATCKGIWRSVGGEPKNFEEFHLRWTHVPEPLKRHLSRPDGVSAQEAAEITGFEKHTIANAIKAGVLNGYRVGARWVIARADLNRWTKRHGALSSNRRSRLHQNVLTLEHASSRSGLSMAVLRKAITDGKLRVVRRDAGPHAKGRRFFRGVRVHELAALRAEKGQITVKEAARRLGLTPAGFVLAARAIGWRPGRPMHSRIVHMVRNHRKAKWQLSIPEAAARLNRSEAWVRAAMAAGFLRPLRGVDGRRIMVGRKRIEQWLRKGTIPELPSAKRARKGIWLSVAEASNLAGVSTHTLHKWAREGQLTFWTRPDSRYYLQSSVEAAARRHWSRRPRTPFTKPAWLTAEQNGAAA